MNPGRLNVFQKTQLLWENVHPYNAAQFITLDCPLSVERLTHAFHQAVRDLGLGTFIRNQRNYRVEYANDSVPGISVVSDLETHLSQELNTPFPSIRSFPFRPFVCGQRVGLVYQHWVADSVSIRTVMRGWLSYLLNRFDLWPGRVRLADTGMLSWFSPACSGWSVVSQGCEIIGFSSAMKQVRRIELLKPDQSVRVRILDLDASLLEQCRSRARAAGVTVGDLLSAASAVACAENGPCTTTRKRPNLAMGTIVDLRHRNPYLSDRIFGLYLGFMVSLFRPEDLENFDSALHRATRWRKTHLHKRSAEASQLRMWLGLHLARRMNTNSMIEFYRKRFPLAGGISNVNLTGSWVNTIPQAQAYHRISPTGPLMPIVFTPTTVGNRLNLCYSYKKAILDDSSASRIVNRMIQLLQQNVT